MQVQPTQKPASHWDRDGGIAIIAVLAIVVIVAAIATSGMTTTSVTAVNMQIVYPNGATSGFLGPDSQSPPITGLPLTFSGQGFIEFTLSNSASTITPHSIISISTNTSGFAVNSVSPTLPYTLSPGSSVTLIVTVTAPKTNYDGPLTLVITVE